MVERAISPPNVLTTRVLLSPQPLLFHPLLSLFHEPRVPRQGYRPEHHIFWPVVWREQRHYVGLRLAAGLGLPIFCDVSRFARRIMNPRFSLSIP